MGFFSPYKRHANDFNYKPRFYDPEKEAREQRRQQMSGRRSDDNGEYVPGQYIRSKREAREARKVSEQQNRQGGMKIWVLGLGVILLVLFVYVIVPKLGAIFELATTDSTQTEFERQQQELEEFDPYAPLIIVPNDYQEGDEIEIIEE